MEGVEQTREILKAPPRGVLGAHAIVPRRFQAELRE
jgi:hypothetical protein